MNLAELKECIRTGKPVPRPLDLLLSAATPATRLGMWWRLRGPRHRVDARVISFGNITAGGTGKTPAVIERAEIELAAGRRVAVLTRGYGSRKTEEPLLADTAVTPRICGATFGDEPTLIALRAPGVIIVKTRDRVAGARAAIAAGCDTLLLDDGYQHVALERDENICLIDATNPFGNGHLLPRGILREPLDALSRATHLIFTRCDQATDLEALVSQISSINPAATIRLTRHVFQGIYRVFDGTEVSLEEARENVGVVVCGIGNPTAFEGTVRALGFQQQFCAYDNHGMLPLEELMRGHEKQLLLTEKDAARLEGPVNDRVLALRIALEDFAPVP